MQTYSHFLLTAVLRRPLRKSTEAKKLPEVRTSALLLGSVVPDLALIILTFYFGILDLRRGVSLAPGAGPDPDSMMWALFDDWFFNDPWVIAAQNLFHSPLLLIVFITSAYLLWKRGAKGAGWFFWLCCAAMLHTLIDIPLHHNDGPLLLFPLNWDLRFVSPVSYWDPEHYGGTVFVLEHLLDLSLIAVLLFTYIPKWLRRSGKQGQSQALEADE